MIGAFTLAYPGPSFSSASERAPSGGEADSPHQSGASLTCNDFESTSIAAPSNTSSSFTTTASVRTRGGCEILITISSPNVGNVAPLKGCTVLVEPAGPSPEATGKRGVSFNLRTVGPPECSDLQISSSVELTPSASAPPRSALATVAPDALCGSYTRTAFFGKITGQDIVNVDMIWNRPHLSWYHDGCTAESGSWWHTDGHDQFWRFDGGFTVHNTNQSGVQYYSVDHSQKFHSDGFPAPSFPNVNADTEIILTGWYNGYATCSFPVRRYDSGAIFYPYLHWFPNECYYE